MQAAARAARKATIGDQGHLLAQAHAHDGAGRAEHLLHPRTAARAFVADNDHLAGFTSPARMPAWAYSCDS